MTFLPLIERELRVLARSPSSYWTRSAVAFAAIVICVPMLLSSGPFYSPSTIGKGVFDGVVTSAFLFTCSAVLLTAGSVANERRQGTLGLLFLTSVRSFDIVVGKLGSLGLLSLGVLVAFLPVLAIPFLAGGVTGGEAFRKALVLMDTLFFALSAGLWSSARDQKANKALLPALWFIVALVLGPFLLQFLLRGIPSIGLFSPLTTLIWASDYKYRSSAAPFWLSASAVNLLAWFFLLTAGFRLRSAAYQEGAEPVAAAAAQFRPIDILVRRRWQPGRVSGSPLEWLASRQRGLSAALWAAALLRFFSSGLWLLWGRFFAGVGVSGIWAMQAPAYAISMLSTGLLAWAAGRFLVEARRTGELELLLTTPLGATSLVNTYWRMLKRLLWWPLAVMLVPSALQIVFYIFMWNGRFAAVTPPYWLANYLGLSILNIFISVLAILTVCSLGIWFGLRSRGYGRLIIWSILLNSGIPYAISLCGRVLLSLVTPVFGASATRVVIGGSRTSSFFIISWVPQILVFVYFLFLFLWVRYHAFSPGTPETEQFELRSFISSTPLWTTMRKMRHWTPVPEQSGAEVQKPVSK